MRRDLSLGRQHTLTAGWTSRSAKRFRMLLLIIADVTLRAHQVVRGQLVASHRISLRCTSLRMFGNNRIGGASEIGCDCCIILPRTHTRKRDLAPLVQSAAQNGKMPRWRVYLTKMRQVETVESERLMPSIARVPVFE